MRVRITETFEEAAPQWRNKPIGYKDCLGGKWKGKFRWRYVFKRLAYGGIMRGRSYPNEANYQFSMVLTFYEGDFI